MATATQCYTLELGALMSAGPPAGVGGPRAGPPPGVGLLQAPSGMGPPSSIPICSPINIGAGAGFSLVVLIGMFGHVSGGHFNPQVTLGLTSIGAVEPVKAVLYVAAQIVGSIVGAAFAWGLIGPDGRHEVAHSAVGGFMRFNRHPYGLIDGEGSPFGSLIGSNGQFFAFEFLLSMFLAAVYVAISFDKRAPRNLAAVLIGLVFFATAAGFAIFEALGNAVMAFGPAVLYGVFHRHWLYWVCGLPGGVVGAQLYKWLFLVPDDNDVVVNVPKTVVEERDKGAEDPIGDI